MFDIVYYILFIRIMFDDCIVISLQRIFKQRTDIEMSQLNLFQNFVKEIQIVQLLELNPNVSAIMDYFQYLIRLQFNASDKKKPKNRKKQISNQLAQSFATLSREQKVQYYMRVVEDIKHILKGDFIYFRQLNTGMINDIGYSRSFNIRRWKQKQLRLDQDKHILFAQRQNKIKTYQLKDYMLRLSKNKDYFSFVLQAINTNPVEKSRTVHLGFSSKPIFQKWFKAIKTSIEFKQWQYYLSLMKSKFIGTKTFNMIMANNENIQEKHNNTFTQANKYQKQEEYQNIFLSQSMMVSGKQEFSKKKQLSPIRPVSNSTNTSPVKSFNIKQKEQSLKKDESEKVKLQQEIKVYEDKKIENKLDIGKTYVDQLIQGDVFQQPDVFLDKVEDEEQEKKETKKNLDLFHKLYPQYELDQLQIYFNYKIIYQEQNFKIFQNEILEKRLKLVISYPKYNHSVHQLISLISKTQLNRQYNDNIEEINVKTFISSQNSALIYQILKPYNRLYRSRDFIFIRHVFKSNNNFYMIDKSIQNSHYPPFMTIVRGQLCNVYGIFDRQNTYQLIADFQVANQGYLNLVQETNLTLKYLKGFINLKNAKIDPNSYKFFNLQWDLNKNEANNIQNEIRVRRKTIIQLNKKSSSYDSKEEQNKNFSKKNPYNQNKIENYQQTQKIQQKVKQNKIQNEKDAQKVVSYSIPNTKQPSQKVEIKRFDKQSMDQIGQLNAEQIKASYKTDLAVLRNLDKNGYVLINDAFRTHKYIISPLEKYEKKLMSSAEGHPVWKNQWIHDTKQGGIIFVHRKKIEDQKGVLKFILSKMAKNLVTGQSILNISLPVDIFAAQSNLQRFLYSMLYGPLLLQGLENESAINRLLRVIIFGISNSILYLSMEKPFNPILGQTFQCWINGCPAYAQQISHHPPIGALIFKGRGYDITAQLESKVSLGVNSGTGTNDGIYRVKFKDNIEICFITPGGQVSGLAHGDRKFNLVGKSYFWITNQNIMLQLVCDPYKKGFFSTGKQQQPSDYLQGTIYEVKPQFMTKFLGGKYKQPEQKDRIKSLGKITGIWSKCLRFNGQQIYNFDKEYPLLLQYQSNPLPSDSNWRQDIEYRRRLQTTRAQNEKQRLQILQRKDRKLRQKYHKKK